jgi:NAD(P)-dependent dehydrogenase (short-subunit alcohol dehydrogenase family)
LTGRSAIVTGGSKGIGLAIAKEFASAGANVAIIARGQKALELAVEEIRGSSRTGGVRAVSANAGDPEQIARAVETVMDAFLRVDILVNNAATNPYWGDLAKLDVERAEKTFMVNQMGPLIWIQECWRRWMADHGGVVVNMCSIGGFTVNRKIGFYNTTKAALIHMTRHLAAEMGPQVRVNALAPGLVKTEMARALWGPLEAKFSETLPLRRLGTPEDIAAATLFLASDASSWMTGQVLAVDGGSSVVPAEMMVGGWGD